MAIQRKPVIVRRFSREWSAGFADSDFRGNPAEMELLEPGGRLMRISWESVKWVCFVRELPSGGANSSASDPERLLRKHFSVRPRTAGLLLRLTLTDGEELEGLAANDLSLIDRSGVLLTPPDTRSNTQRIYIPLSSIDKLEVVARIGGNARKAQPPASTQKELFPGPDESA